MYGGGLDDICGYGFRVQGLGFRRSRVPGYRFSESEGLQSFKPEQGTLNL
jgi:hypothetical protein